MGSLFGGKKKSAPAPAPVAEAKPAVTGATREEKLAASRRRAGGGRSDNRPLMSLADRLGPGSGPGRNDLMTARAEKDRLGG